MKKYIVPMVALFTLTCLGGSVLYCENEQTEYRVAALEQQNEELENKISSMTDALEQCKAETASLTDAINNMDFTIEYVNEDKSSQTNNEIGDDDKDVSSSVPDSVRLEMAEIQEQQTQQQNANNTVTSAATREEDESGAVIQEQYEVYEEIETEQPISEEQPAYTYYGTKELTAYAWTGNPCADGAYPQMNYTAASNDPNLWHRWVYIPGYGDFYIHDTGGMSKSVIDLYMGDTATCLQFGRRTAEIYIYD